MKYNKEADLDVIFWAQGRRCCDLDKVEGRPQEISLAVMAILTSQMARIANLDIVSILADLPGVIGTLSGCPAPRLRTCHLDYYHPVDDDAHSDEEDEDAFIAYHRLRHATSSANVLFNWAPRLKAVSWAVYSPPESSELWDDLRCIRVMCLQRRHSIQEWLGILARSPKLQHLDIKEAFDKPRLTNASLLRPPEPTKLVQISLSYLVRLDIVLHSIDQLTTFFDGTKLPCLEGVKIIVETAETDLSLHTLLHQRDDLRRLLGISNALDIRAKEEMIALLGYNAVEGLTNALEDNIICHMIFGTVNLSFLDDILDDFTTLEYLRLSLPFSPPTNNPQQGEEQQLNLGIGKYVSTLDIGPCTTFPSLYLTSLANRGTLPALQTIVGLPVSSTLPEAEMRLFERLLANKLS